MLRLLLTPMVALMLSQSAAEAGASPYQLELIGSWRSLGVVSITGDAYERSFTLSNAIEAVTMVFNANGTGVFDDGLANVRQTDYIRAQMREGRVPDEAYTGVDLQAFVWRLDGEAGALLIAYIGRQSEALVVSLEKDRLLLVEETEGHGTRITVLARLTAQ